MDTVTKKEYNIRDLGTKSVTLFPSRAQIVREIKDLQLAPGANEITIVGLTPTVDEESIKVEGSGSAIISDIAIELLPNRDIFQEIYPDSDDDKSATDSESEPEDEEEQDPPELLAVRDKLCSLRDEQKRAKETISSAESRLKILDAYGKMLDRKKTVQIEDGIETYRTEREKVFTDHLAGTIRERELNKEIMEAAKEEMRLLKIRAKERERIAKAKAKIQKVKAKEQEKKDRREAQRKKEKARIRKERENFWAKYCYSVTITLDAAAFTPMSSRRTSIASEADVQLVKEKAAGEKSTDTDLSPPNSCDLSLTYVTSSAFWAPSYDLQLSSTNNTAMLCFDAQLTNATSETWSNAKVTLSTSQTTFAGLEDNLPTLVPWHVKLAGRGSGILENDILNSREERSEQMGWEVQQRQYLQVQKPRANLFGVWEAGQSVQEAKQVQQQMEQTKMAQVQMLKQNVENARQGNSNNYMSNALSMPPPPPGGGIYSSNLGAPPMAQMAQMPRLARSAAPASKAMMSKRASAPMKKAKGGFGFKPSASTSFGGGASFDELAEECDEDESSSEGYGDDGTIMEPQPELDFQDSAIEETGLTTTYDLPGLKTLAPKSTASKQRVARVNFSNIVFSHTVVAKYKPVAYLKAKLKNNSKLTLLKGAAGLTLDGSFMGRTKLPRCSAGDSFYLSLGIDPAIRVVYPKPEVRRSTTGLFAKEDCSVYTRTVTIANTKASAGKSVSILVLDQVPVSQDERLRVDVLAPRGMVLGGNGVPTGVPAKDAKDDKDWGKATAVLKKGGEVAWDVSLKAGRAVKLGLEYDVGVPAGEHVTQC